MISHLSPALPEGVGFLCQVGIRQSLLDSQFKVDIAKEVEVGGDAGAAKAGHGGARVGTIRKGSVGSAETGRGFEKLDSVPVLELFLASVIDFEEEETGVAGLGVKKVWK